MDKIKIDRINELGRLSKQRELTEEEKKPYNTEIAKRKIELLKEILN